MFDHKNQKTDHDITDATVQTLLRVTNQQVASPSEYEAKKRRRRKKAQKEKEEEEEDEIDIYAKDFLPSAYQIHENIRMGPLAKWRKKRMIPWKIILHAIIVTLVTVLILLYTQKRQPFFRRQGEGFAQLFLPESHKNIEESGYDTYIAFLRNIDDVIDDVKKTVSTYYSLSNTSVDSVLYLPKSRSEPNIIRPIKATARLWNQNPRHYLEAGHDTHNVDDLKYSVVRDDLSDENPLGLTLGNIITNDTRLFFDRLNQLKLEFDYQSLDVSAFSTSKIAECIQWTLYKTYEFHGSGSLAVTLFYEYNECENIKSAPKAQFRKATTWISLFLMICSFISQFLTFKSIIKRIRYFLHIRKGTKLIRRSSGRFSKSLIPTLDLAQKIGLPLGDIKLSDFPKFVSLWYLVQWMADICNIVSFFLLILDHIDTVFPPLFLGAGAFISWLSILRFFQYAPSFYALIVTIRNGIPNAFRYFVCVLPIFLGFSIAGTTIFGHYNRNFDDVQEASISLFCMLNGDAIHHIFDGLSGINGFMAFSSRVYVYVFCILFITTILNIFILIMQDAFEKTRQEFAEKSEAEKLLFDRAASENENPGEGSRADGSSDDSSDVYSYSSDELDLEDNVTLFREESSDNNEQGGKRSLTKLSRTKRLQEQLQEIADQQAKKDGAEPKSLKYIFDEESPLENIDRIQSFVRELARQRTLQSTEDALIQELLDKLDETAESLKTATLDFRGHTIGNHIIDENYYEASEEQNYRLSRTNTFYHKLKNQQR